MTITNMTYGQRRVHLAKFKTDKKGGLLLPAFGLYCSIDASTIDTWSIPDWNSNKGEETTLNKNGKEYDFSCGYTALVMCLSNNDASPGTTAHDICVSDDNWDDSDYDVDSIEACQAKCKLEWEDFKRVHEVQSAIDFQLERWRKDKEPLNVNFIRCVEDWF